MGTVRFYALIYRAQRWRRPKPWGPSCVGLAFIQPPVLRYLVAT